MPHFKSNDAEIYYEKYGNGPPVIFIGGLGNNIEYWLAFKEHISPFCEMYALDNRGIGKTTIQNPFSVIDMAKDIKALMDHCKIEKASVVGISMGGAIAQTFALDFPESTEKLVLVATTAKFNEVCRLSMLHALQLLHINAPVELKTTGLFPWIFASSFLSNEQNVSLMQEKIFNSENPQSAEGFQAQCLALQQFDSSKQLNKINAKTLIMYGDEDVLTPKKDALFLHKEIKGSELVEIEQSGHSIPIEKPTVFLEKLFNFIRKT